MKVRILLLALVCAVTWAADNLAVSSPAIANQKSAIINGVDAITIPRMLSYQGKLVDSSGSRVPDSAYSVTFRLFTQSGGGTAFWSETQPVQTRGGLFSCLLGLTAPVTGLPEDGNCWLEMQVNPDAALSPRVRIASAAYCYLARKSDTANYALAGTGGGRDTLAFHHNDTNDAVVDSSRNSNELFANGVHVWTHSRDTIAHRMDFPGNQGGLVTIWSAKAAPTRRNQITWDGFWNLDTTHQVGHGNPPRTSYIGFAYNDTPVGFGHIARYESSKVYTCAVKDSNRAFVLVSGSSGSAWSDTSFLDSKTGFYTDKHYFKGDPAEPDSELVTRGEASALAVSPAVVRELVRRLDAQQAEIEALRAQAGNQSK